jgi:cell division protein ZapA
MSEPERASAKGVTITIMGREFRVAAPGGEEQALAASVEFLNKKMREIRDTGKVVGNERIAIMAALNIAHDYLQLQGGAKPAKGAASTNAANDSEIVKDKLAEFEKMLDKAVSDQEKLF